MLPCLLDQLGILLQYGAAQVNGWVVFMALIPTLLLSLVPAGR
jgi:hypothetical protein